MERTATIDAIQHSGASHRRFPLTAACVFLLLLRAAALTFGLDRLPMIPTVNPEVVINDPAVALSQGRGLVAFSFEHSVNGLDRVYGHFPPLFIAIQAAVFHLFGFSGLTLRASSIVFDLAACCVFLAILGELHRQNIIDRLGLIAASGLILLEPTALVHAREARMESLNTLLGGIAFYFCVRATRDTARHLVLWISAAIAIGLALAAHPAAILMWVPFALWSISWFRRLGLWRWLAIEAVPPGVMVIAWLLAWGRHTVEALNQMRHLAAFAGVATLRVDDFIQSLSHGAIRAAQNAGGLGLVYAFAALFLALARLLQKPGTPNPAWRITLGLLTATLLIQFTLLQFVVPTSGMNRVVMILPFALVCAGIALSYLPVSARRLTVFAVAAAAALQLLVTVAFLSELRHGWKDRSPARFDSLVAALPPETRVAGPPELWFAFRSHNRQFAVIYRAMGEETYWERPHSFDGYDAVILDPGWPRYQAWRQKAAPDRPFETVLHTFGRDFLVIAKKPINP